MRFAVSGVGPAHAVGIVACMVVAAGLFARPVPATADTPLPSPSAVSIERGTAVTGGSVGTQGMVWVRADVPDDVTIDCAYWQLSSADEPQPTSPPVDFSGNTSCYQLEPDRDPATGLRYLHYPTFVSSFTDHTLTVWSGSSADTTRYSAPTHALIPAIASNSTDPGQARNIAWTYATPPPGESLPGLLGMPDYSALHVAYDTWPAQLNLAGSPLFSFLHFGRDNFAGQFTEAGQPVFPDGLAGLITDPGWGFPIPPGSAGQWVTVYLGYANATATAWTLTSIPILLGHDSSEQATITAPARIVSTAAFTVSGTVRVDTGGTPQVGAAVTLYAAKAGGSYVIAAHTITNQYGRYAFTVHQSATTSRKVVVAGRNGVARSPAVTTVEVPILSARLAATTITHGTATTISGAVTPVFAAAQVNIYRCPTTGLTGCRLATTTRTSSTGAYRAPVKASLTGGRVLWVRARLIASSTHAEDWSAPLSLRAR